MTAAEWMELYTASSANSLTAQATILTMVSGYLVVAYSVGSKLSTLQVAEPFDAERYNRNLDGLPDMPWEDEE